MNIVNCTPHAIVLRLSDDTERVFPPSGVVPRVSSTPGSLGEIDGIPVASPTVFGEVEGLPEPVEGTLLLVSGMAGGALAGIRSDILVPGTGPQDGAIRNDKGHIVAVTRFNRV